VNPIRSGQLTRRIRIQRRSTVQDSFGGPALTWIDVASVWAGIEPLTGRELESAQRMASEVSHQITVRYQALFADPREVAGYRILFPSQYRARIFNIHAAINEEERNAVITLLASEGLDDG
jgi:SPP1 family predicted phage head-tail adaptor